MLDLRGARERHPVRDGGGDDRGPESIRPACGRQPREVPAVAPAAHADAIGVHEALGDERVHAGEDVLELETAEVLLVGDGEGRAAAA